MNRLIVWLPVLVLLSLIALFVYAMLGTTSRQNNLPLVGEPLPSLPLSEFSLTDSGFDPATLDGPYLINVWASWCAPCRIEHPFLMELNQSGVPIYGIVYKDQPDNAIGFLNELGDPFTGLAADPEGRVGLELGLTGAPETFVVDHDGIIRARWRGAISEPVWNQTLGRAYYEALEETG